MIQKKEVCMARFHILKNKSCKRVGANLWLLRVPPKPFSQKRLSAYGTRLRLSRLVSLMYGNIHARTYEAVRRSAFKHSGKFGPNVLALLEKRLDISLFRLNFCTSISEARQLIRHKRVFVNTRCAAVSGFQLRRGDVIRVCLNESLCARLHAARSMPVKPLHFETSFALGVAIFLYAPQQLAFATHVDVSRL